MLSETQCRYVLRRYVSALRRARSLIRDATSPYVDADRSLAKIDSDAARFDPWLFSDECEQVMTAMAALTDPLRAGDANTAAPSPIDVMNFSSLLGTPSRTFKDEELTPGNSKFWAVELPADVYQFVADPTLVFAPPADRHPVEDCLFSSETMAAVGWGLTHTGPERLGTETPVHERRELGRNRL